MNRSLKIVDTVRGEFAMRQLQKAIEGASGGTGNTLIRALLSVALMAGFMLAYTLFGNSGLIVLALLVLLGISHPFWLLAWRERVSRAARGRPEIRSRLRDAHALTKDGSPERIY